MGSNILLFGWNRSLTGREKLSAEHFGEFVKYLEGLQKKGAITSFRTVFLDAHGGDLNGFFLIEGEPGKLDDLVGSEAWEKHMIRAVHHLQEPGVVRGVTGEKVMDRMKLWSGLIPS